MWQNKKYLSIYSWIFSAIGFLLIAITWIPIYKLAGFQGAFLAVFLPATICAVLAVMCYRISEEANRLIKSGADLDFNFAEIAGYSIALFVAFLGLMTILIWALVGGVFNIM